MVSIFAVRKNLGHVLAATEGASAVLILQLNKVAMTVIALHPFGVYLNVSTVNEQLATFYNRHCHLIPCRHADTGERGTGNAHQFGSIAVIITTIITQPQGLILLVQQGYCFGSFCCI